MRLLIVPALVQTLCVGLLFPLTGNASGDRSIRTGSDLAQYCNSINYAAQNQSWLFCMGYVYGVGLETRRLQNANPPIVPQFCVPSGMSKELVEQEGVVVSKYLENHPEVLNQDVQNTLVGALSEKWPCKTAAGAQANHAGLEQRE